jgi:exopolyphosphatase/guanosine-5'-triphosphate,3'-diphosphate pyrophosphatase
VVQVLAGLLRVADALDRSHKQVVRRIVVRERQGVLRLQAEARGDCELELWGVGGRTALLEEALDLRLRIDTAPVAAPSPRRALLRA